ncbi:hypothetical protein LTSEMON_3844 [Salmonella enterica subsp. enterica serovar Montevideo str. S5-403]|uniref:Uncharacterized protein n=1 Tax=Salmonella enterica subsp. enterica serovar Montevideo str. S5-403 TaxID=913242 RepID=G5Q6G0_SALMO|nr:hypothetical protein LTSEMON_3844 [Salmonella enterica subsp. enterica serovar Montevideo str. S5-403]
MVVAAKWRQRVGLAATKNPYLEWTPRTPLKRVLFRNSCGLDHFFPDVVAQKKLDSVL